MKNSIKNKIIDNFPVFIFVIIIIIAINGCFFAVSYSNLGNLRDELLVNDEENRWQIVRNEILKQYAFKSADINYISKKLECAILREYANNLDELKQNFDDSKFDEKLYNLFKREIGEDSSSPNKVTEKDSYNYILGFHDSILAIFSDKNIDENMSNYKTWAEYFNASANVKLNESLISNISNKNLSETLLMYQNGNLESYGTVVNAHNVDALETIFKEQGLDGLKQIDFVNVAYITEYGDIFGTDDYLYLEKVSNYKMILVGTSNIYDTIETNVSKDISKYNAETELTQNKISQEITRRCLEFITVTLCLLMSIIVFGSFYNKSIDKK